MKKKLFCDLKLDVDQLPNHSILEMINVSVNEGYSIIALTRTVQLGQHYQQIDIKSLKLEYEKKYNQQLDKTLLLNRVNYLLSDIKLVATKKSKDFNNVADLISIEPTDLDTLNKLLKLYNNNGIFQVHSRDPLNFYDHVLFIDLNRISLNSATIKALCSKGVFVEFSYGSFLRKSLDPSVFVNFYKLMNSQIKRLVVSSGVSRKIHFRSSKQVSDLFVGLLNHSDNKNLSVGNKLLMQNPCELLRMSKMKREGVIQIK